MVEATVAPDVSHFDLRRDHMMITGVGGVKTIVQNGFVYAYTVPDNKVPHIGGKIIGKVADMKPLIQAQGHFMCDFCGFSFGEKQGLQAHLYEKHRDYLLAHMIRTRPDDLKLGEVPTEDQLVSESERIVAGEEVQALEDAKNRVPEVKAFNENKTRRKGAYRTPIRS